VVLITQTRQNRFGNKKLHSTSKIPWHYNYQSINTAKLCLAFKHIVLSKKCSNQLHNCYAIFSLLFVDVVMRSSWCVWDHFKIWSVWLICHRNFYSSIPHIKLRVWSSKRTRKIMSSGMWQCVTGWVVPDVSKEHSVFPFKVQAVQEQPTWKFFFWLPDLWKWRQCLPSKQQEPVTKRHRVTPVKIWNLNYSTVRPKKLLQKSRGPQVF
jgi:hypothetical protein